MILSKTWTYNQQGTGNSESISKQFNITPIVAQLLINRGINTPDLIEDYLYPTTSQIHSPFLFEQMEACVLRIKQAIEQKEPIYIYGDYDVDGTTATALLINTFSNLNYPAHYYIPNRFDEGYGLNDLAIRNLAKSGCKLIITVDCGITAVKEIKLARELDMDVIITDHHEPPPTLPPANAIISPHLPGQNQYPYKNLAGVGLAFKVAHALKGGGTLGHFLRTQLDLVTLGTVADIAPLTGENRTLTKIGLEELNKKQRVGLRALLTESGISRNKKINGQILSYTLGPRINAAGRMGVADTVIELLTTENMPRAINISKSLNRLNTKRKEVEQTIISEATSQIESQDPTSNAQVVIGENWHLGVIGIVASKLVDKYHKPIFVLSAQGENAHGSGRSIKGFNIAEALEEMDDILIKHGGHASAAGLTIKVENVHHFTRKLIEKTNQEINSNQLTPNLSIDFKLDDKNFNLKTVEQFNLLEPFGAENRSPIFSLYNLHLEDKPKIMGSEKNHLKLLLTNGNKSFEAVGWNMAHYHNELIKPDQQITIAFRPEINFWNNQRKLQLVIEDIQTLPIS